MIAGAKGITGDPLDPVRNVALPCEAVSTPGLVPRAAKNIAHVANVCGFVGTDIEFQSRTAADGTCTTTRSSGRWAAGTRIFDVTDPAHPVAAGRYTDPGYQNDVQVSGDVLVLGFDSLGASRRDVRLPARTKGAGTAGQTKAGVDIVRLVFDPRDGDLPDAARRLLPVEPRARRARTRRRSIRAATYLTVNTSFNGLEVVDIRTDAGDARPDDSGDGRRRRARRLVLARRQHALQRRARLDADPRRDGHLQPRRDA